MNFPILRLQVAAFKDHYLERGNATQAKRFRKLSFILKMNGSPNRITLQCFALKDKREVMHAEPIILEDRGDGSVNHSVPFSMGTLEIKYADLADYLVGPYDDMNSGVRYLRFEARKVDGFIGYNIYKNNSTTLMAPFEMRNPCPPWSQD